MLLVIEIPGDPHDETQDLPSFLYNTVYVFRDQLGIYEDAKIVDSMLFLDSTGTNAVNEEL